jgi:hypothetical protein
MLDLIKKTIPPVALALSVVSTGVVSPLLSLAEEPKAEAKEENNEEPSAEEGAAKKEKKRSPTKYVAPGTDPRGLVDLTICSQNLKLFGTYETVKSRAPNTTKGEHELKLEELTKRFVTARCDVIAMQEVMGEKEGDAKAALDELAAQIRRVTNRVFISRVAPVAEGKMTLGYLIAQDRATVVSALSYAKIELPIIGEKERPRVFQRTPMELQVTVGGRDGGEPRTVSIVNFHFKSKRGGASDPTGLEFETYRMEMAEALRRIVESRHQQSFASGESILVVLGDRNGNFDVASARILEGSLVLANFRKDGGCRLSKRGVPLCKTGISLPQRLFSVFARNERSKQVPGTFSYQGEYSWLDDILMPAESLSYAWRSAFKEGVYDSGVVYEPKGASDHALVYVRLNW